MRTATDLAQGAEPEPPGHPPAWRKRLPQKRSRTSPIASRWALPVALAALYGLFFFWPLLSIALRSLRSDGSLSYRPSGFSLDNYRSLLIDPLLRDVLVNTVSTASISTLITFVLAFPTAYLMSRLQRSMSTALFMLVLLPFWVSILVRLFAFLELLSSNGPVNGALEAIGVGRQALLFNSTGTVIGMVNYLLPYMILVLFAAMSGIDPNLTRAAKSLGCSSWQAFRSVYLPLIRGSIVGALLLNFIIATGFFLTPAILGGPQDVTISTYIATQVQNYRWGPASAFGVVLLVATFAVFAVAGRMTGLTAGSGIAITGSKGVSRGEAMPFGPAKLGLWTVSVLVIAFLFAPIAFVFPLSWGTDATIVFPPRGFTLDWYHLALTDPVWTAALHKSVTVGLAVAVLCIVLAILIARWVRTLDHRPHLQSLVVSIIYLPVIVPVILLAIGTFDVQNQIGILGSWWGLVMVETILALPFTYLVVAAALNNVDSSLERAAWTMGASRFYALRKVVIPTVVPAITGAALLAFISSWDEAVVALFQTSFDKTLPVNFYASLKSGSSPVIAAIGAMLMLLVLVSGALFLTVQTIRSRRGRTPTSTPSSDKRQP
ncbi:putative spermidine/putrescine transport system permease protein [Arthrobacter sp. SLBN-53]|nr:putative spermidine/putrescine transport system permease protein [Arthrobacter sp. SLBN-53]